MPDYCNFECTSLSNVKTTIRVVIQKQNKYGKQTKTTANNQNNRKTNPHTITEYIKKLASPVPGMTPVVYKDDTNIFSRGNSDL